MARGGWGGKAAGNCQVVSRPTSLCCAQLIKATSVLDRPPPQGEGGGTETACVGVRAWSVCVRRQRKGEVGVGERKRTKMVVDAGLIPSSRSPLKSQPVRSTVLSMHMTDLVSISTDPPPTPTINKGPPPLTHTHARSSSFLGFTWRWMGLLHLYSLDVYFLMLPAHLDPDCSSFPLTLRHVPLGEQTEDNNRGQAVCTYRNRL